VTRKFHPSFIFRRRAGPRRNVIATAGGGGFRLFLLMNFCRRFGAVQGFERSQEKKQRQRLTSSIFGASKYLKNLLL
jgi:hypothetical protein